MYLIKNVHYENLDFGVSTNILFLKKVAYAHLLHLFDEKYSKTIIL